MDIGEMGQRADQLVKELTELCSTVGALAAGDDIASMREQLRVIGSSIRQLENKRVSVPDHLRSLKTDLITKISYCEDASEVRKKLADALMDSLSHLGLEFRGSKRRQAPHKDQHPKVVLPRSVQFGGEQKQSILNFMPPSDHMQKTDAASPVASGSRARYTVTIHDLLRSGILKEGTNLLHRGRRGVFSGKLKADGQVEVSVNGRHVALSLSGAANAVFGGSRNGWDFWFAVQEDGKEVLLADLRDRMHDMHERNRL